MSKTISFPILEILTLVAVLFACDLVLVPGVDEYTTEFLFSENITKENLVQSVEKLEFGEFENPPTTQLLAEHEAASDSVDDQNAIDPVEPLDFGIEQSLTIGNKYESSRYEDDGQSVLELEDSAPEIEVDNQLVLNDNEFETSSDAELSISEDDFQTFDDTYNNEEETETIVQAEIAMDSDSYDLDQNANYDASAMPGETVPSEAMSSLTPTDQPTEQPEPSEFREEVTAEEPVSRVMELDAPDDYISELNSYSDEGNSTPDVATEFQPGTQEPRPFGQPEQLHQPEPFQPAGMPTVNIGFPASDSDGAMPRVVNQDGNLTVRPVSKFIPAPAIFADDLRLIKNPTYSRSVNEENGFKPQDATNNSFGKKSSSLNPASQRQFQPYQVRTSAAPSVRQPSNSHNTYFQPVR